MNTRGFTLLEIIIAVAILAFISMYTAQTIQNGVRSKVKIQKNLEQEAILRDALKVISEDIRQAFNYRDVNVELYNLAQEQREKQSKKGNTPKKPDDSKPPTDPPPAEPPPPTPGNNQNKKFTRKTEVIVTQFIGQKNQLNFSSLSFARSVANSPFSDQAEVGYFLRDCRNRLEKRERSQCLWRRISPVIDEKIEEDGSETVLLEQVKEFRLRYIGPGSEDTWRDDWMTDERGDATTKGQFPYAVEITLGVKDQRSEEDKTFAMTIVAPIANPNNKENLPVEETGAQPPAQ